MPRLRATLFRRSWQNCLGDSGFSSGQERRSECRLYDQRLRSCKPDGEGRRYPWCSFAQDRGARGLSKRICPRFAGLEKRSKSPSRGSVGERRPGDHGMCSVPSDEEARSRHLGAVPVIRQTIGTPSLWGSRAVRWWTRLRGPQARILRVQSGISKEHERECVISHR